MLRHRVLRRAALRVWVPLGKKTIKKIGARSLYIATSKKTARRAGAGRFLEVCSGRLVLGGMFWEACFGRHVLGGYARSLPIGCSEN